MFACPVLDVGVLNYSSVPRWRLDQPPAPWAPARPITWGCASLWNVWPNVCTRVHNLMCHLKGSDSSRSLRREARLVLSQCGGCLHPEMWHITQEEKGRKAELAQRIMRTDTFPVRVLFVWLYLVFIKEKKAETCSCSWDFHWLLSTSAWYL